ncbi:MAG TPA: ABC transporter permease [Streptosporangiaceae bacterium]|nr:ABC transporter permease [Streptosporangiaceae bacterium]
MGAVAMVLRARLRQYWKSWLALSLLIAVVGGFVLAAVVTGRRTAAAFPGFVARHGYDMLVYAGHPLPQLAKLPQVAHVTTALLPFAGPPRCASCRKPIDYGSFGVFEVAPPGLARMVKLLSGRMPDQSDPHEALASYTLARDNGVRLGSVIEAPTLTPAQMAGVNQGRQPRTGHGPRLTLRIVGIVATENEFPAGNGVRYDLFPSAAFAAAVNQRVGLLPVYFLRLRHGPADLPAVDSRLRPLQVLGTDPLDTDAAAVQRDIRPQAVGWLVLAGLAALAGLAVIGQAIARQSATEQADHHALSALGLGFRDLVLVAMARAAAIGAVGAAGAVAVAALLSPLTPVGEARLATAAPGGLVFDPLVLPLGGLVTVAAVVVLATVPAVRSARLLPTVPPPQAGPARLVSAVAAAGAPPSALIGVRNALERRRGGQQVPVGTALLGTVLAVAALCATAVFGASQAHLLSSPALYGLPYQVSFSNLGSGSGAAITGPVLTSLRRDRAIQRISLATTEEIAVNGRQVGLLAVTAVRGPALISAVDGRLPEHDREIALGTATMNAIGARPGGLVRVAVTDATGTPHRASFRVVGRASFPAGSGTGGLGTGAAMTVGALIDAQCPPGPGQLACQRAARRGVVWDVLVRSAPGPAGAAALARHVRAYHQYATRPATPTELVNFGEAVNFPLLFGVMLSLFGAATMVHLLLVSVTRRRRDTGLLKVLGFVRHQVAAAVCWQASTIAVIGIVAGVPLGVAAGQFVWRAFATNFGVVPVAVVQPFLLVALAGAVLVAANALAVVPALLAARSRPGPLIRAE